VSLLQAFVARRLAGRFSSITDFTLPSDVDAGVQVPFLVAGHLDSIPSPVWPNFAVGFYYEGGPMERIRIQADGESFELSPGTVVFKVTETLPPECTSLRLDINIEGLDAGTYRFAALTGYVTEDTFFYDDRVDRSVEAKAPAWPWWVLPLAAGIGVVAVIGGVVLYTEERRREMMLLMMRR